MRRVPGKTMIKLRTKISCVILASELCLLVSALVVLGAANPVQAESFGQIFTTPKQRAILDNIRRYSKQKKPKQKNAKSRTPQAVFDKKGVSVNGIVTRSDGNNTVWINGKSNLKTNQPESGVSVYRHSVTSDSVTLTLSKNPSKRVTLKPGQSVDPRSGIIRDSYR